MASVELLEIVQPHIDDYKFKEAIFERLSIPPRAQQNRRRLKTEDKLGTTFGIELELIVVYTCPRNGSKHAEAIMEEKKKKEMELLVTPLGQKAIYEAIRAFSCRVDYKSVPLHDPSDLEYSEQDYSKWQLTPDGSLRLTSVEEKQLNKYCEKWEGVELVSRVYNTGRDDWESELRTVLAAVHSLNTPNMQVLVNTKCGLHVHVGNGLAGIPLPTQQKTMKLAMAFERVIDCLHAVPRFNGHLYAAAAEADTTDFDYTRLYNTGLAEILRQEGSSVRAGLAAINATKTSGALATLVSGGSVKRCTYNLHDQLKSDEKMDDSAACSHAIRTIEFRQHRGTLAFEEIRAWVLFTTELVRFAHDKSCEDIDDLVEQRFADRKYTPLRFLRDLDMPKPVISFYKDKCKSRSRAAEMVKGAQALPEGACDAWRRRGLNALMDFLNETWVESNSWEVVKAAVAERMKMGMYGLDDTGCDVTSEDSQDDGDKNGRSEIPGWLKGRRRAVGVKPRARFQFEKVKSRRGASQWQDGRNKKEARKQEREERQKDEKRDKQQTSVNKDLVDKTTAKKQEA